MLVITEDIGELQTYVYETQRSDCSEVYSFIAEIAYRHTLCAPYYHPVDKSSASTYQPQAKKKARLNPCGPYPAHN